jgi:MoaA/NifB/PqqE/SkfB family radical SAM enzyme
MRAVVKPRINEETHTILGKKVPLEMPYVLVIDPCNLCNLKCKFCPSGNIDLIKSTGRYQGLLDFSLFTKIIDDLRDFPEPLRVLRLYKEGEPLLNRHFPEMVLYAKKSRRIKKIDTTTNGLCLSKKLNRLIIDAGLDNIMISVNGINAEQYYHYTKTNVDFDKFVDNIRDLYENRGNCEIYIKAIKQNLNDDEQKRFFDIFGNIADRIFLENLALPWPRFIFNSDIPMKFEAGNYGQEIIDRKVCPYIFYMMVVNSSGKVSTCIGDWPNKQIVGDLKTHTVKEVWQGSELNKYRLACLPGGDMDKSDFCNSCKVLLYGTVDNLDAYAYDILARMTKN